MKQALVLPIKAHNDPEFDKLIAFFNETLGFCPNSVKTMYHRPEIAYAFIALNKAVMDNKGRVDSTLKRMIGFICSYAAGCQYCQAHTIRAGERYGAESVKLENIWDYKTNNAFSEDERAALDFALAASTIPNSVDDKIANNLRKYWNEGEIVEILGVISLFGFLNRWNDSMGTEIEPDAIISAEKYLTKKDWTGKKHKY